MFREVVLHHQNVSNNGLFIQSHCLLDRGVINMQKLPWACTRQFLELCNGRGPIVLLTMGTILDLVDEVFCHPGPPELFIHEREKRSTLTLMSHIMVATLKGQCLGEPGGQQTSTNLHLFYSCESYDTGVRFSASDHSSFSHKHEQPFYQVPYTSPS